ncbi:MAG: alpha/beta fold hydrolase [Acidovorax sp.]|nr:alpha/beta fold hydrolase [Acidovorax sp.]
MKRIVLATAAAFALVTIALYYGAPSLFKEPLLALNRSLSGLEEKTIDAAMHQIHYLDSGPPESPAAPGGDSTPLVLLHGIFAEKDHWVDFARPLTATYRVIAPDLPGFGESTRHENLPYDYSAHVTRLGAFLDTLGIQRAHLAGNSMGGTIAALYALEHPERVASVAFIGAPHGIRSPQKSTMDRLIDAGHRPLVAHDASAFDAMMALVFEKRPFLPYPVLVATEQEALRNANSNTRLWDAQLKDRYLLDEQLSNLQQHPTLALWGTNDRAFDVSGAQRLQRLLPKARVETLPGIGHLPMMEAPGDTAGRYADFLVPLQPGAGISIQKYK